MKKSCRKCAPDASPRPLFYFDLKKNSHCMQEIILKIRYFEWGLSKTFQKVNLKSKFFLSISVLLMDKIIKNKRRLEIVIIVPLQVIKQVQNNFFISYIISDQVWWYNMKWFLSYSKNYAFKCIQADAQHH